MAFGDEVMELTTETEKQLQQVEMEEEDEQVVGLERKTASFAHGKRPDSADSSSITTANTSSSSSFSGFHGEHDEVNNGIVYLDGEQGSDDHESQTIDHLNTEKKVTEFEKGSSSEDNKGLREIDEEVDVIEEEVDIEDVKDYQAKELLENQKKPELLCPKCKNCITKLVVLKKRVRLTKKVGPKIKKQNSSNVGERPETRPSPINTPVHSEDKLIPTVGGEKCLPGTFFYKCFSCFSIFNIEPKVVDSNPVPLSEVNTQLMHPQESTGCSSWIISMLKKNEPLEPNVGAMPSVVPEANQPRDNHTPMVDDAPPVQDDAVTFIQVPESLDPSKSFDNGAPVENMQPVNGRRLTPMPPSPPVSSPVTSGRNGSTIDIPPTPEEPLLTPVVQGRKPEILKSIVYGGLTEAITSLGVISSAAGSGASTLNILVLGLANLFGGLILIIHNLQELKEEESIRETTEDSDEDETRYKQLLGRRENFMLHATIAILSFIVTGLLPPVVYYFSFRESHNKDYKVASVFGASLICISFLALAKAHVRSPRGSYLKSVLYYATNAVSVSGITYVVGNVVNQLLEKYGWSDGSETPVGEMMFSLMGRKAGGFKYSSSY